MTANLLLRAALAATLAVLVTSSNLWAAKGTGLPGEIPVNATFADAVASSGGIRSDGQGIYFNGADSVRAVLTSIRNFVLDTRNSPPRFFVLDFGSTACATTLERVVDVDFFSTSQLIDNSGNLVNGRLLGMPLGATFRSTAQVFFAIRDTQYFLRFDPTNDFGGSSAYVLITRTDATHWVIQTDADSTASLLRQPLTGKPVITWVADCSMPFELAVACQKEGCAQ